MTKISLTGIIDYGVGNVRSVFNAVEAVGGSPVLTSNRDVLMGCDRLILPGVGAYAHGMAELKARGLDEFLKNTVENNIPLMGICLGMQMLARCSLEFGETTGLGFTDGVVSLIEPPKNATQRLPHVAWKQLKIQTNAAAWLFDGVDPNAKYYFIHSYAVPSTSSDVVATADCEGIDFAAVLATGCVVGTQFHPEKSGPEGLKMLKNFIVKGL